MNLMKDVPHAIIYLQQKGCSVYLHGNDIHVIKPSGMNGIVPMSDLIDLNNEVEQKYSLKKIEKKDEYI